MSLKVFLNPWTTPKISLLKHTNYPINSNQYLNLSCTCLCTLLQPSLFPLLDQFPKFVQAYLHR